MSWQFVALIAVIWWPLVFGAVFNARTHQKENVSKRGLFGGVAGEKDNG